VNPFLLQKPKNTPKINVNPRNQTPENFFMFMSLTPTFSKYSAYFVGETVMYAI